MTAFLQQLGGPEILLILAVLLLVFGAAKVPQLARSLGRSSGEFKAGLREGSDDDVGPDPSPPRTEDLPS